MIAEKTIQICGHDVKMRYCAAAETGYERLSGQSSNIFVPIVEKDVDGNIVNVEQKATADDYLKLAIASIIAAYSRIDQEPPVTADDILYDAPPAEVITLISTVIKLRAQWYDVPAVINTEEMPDSGEDQGESKKNA